MTARPGGPVLSGRELGRATLARQRLLERAPADTDVVDLIEAVGGLQAQEPASPFLALWTRQAGFRPEMLRAAIDARTVVKGTLMRSTLHAVSAADHRRLWPAVAPGSRGIRRQDRGTVPDAAAVAAILEATEAVAAEPRTLAELGAGLGARDGSRRPRS